VVARRFIKAGDKVRAAGTCRAAADAEAAGELGLSRGGESRAFLMADADPLYLAAANRVAQRVKRIADQTEDLPNSNLFEDADHDVGYHLSHCSLLCCCCAAILAASKKLIGQEKAGLQFSE
jgi:NAD(P)-dependent dehydrogenase (short-subunit alcohol dehydrogenase family)